jgi:hypothetical protein
MTGVRTRNTPMLLQGNTVNSCIRMIIDSPGMYTVRHTYLMVGLWNCKGHISRDFVKVCIARFSFA